MKNLNFKILHLLPLLLSVSCNADESVVLSRDITEPPPILSKTSLDSAYLSLTVGEKQYYAGFFIDAEGVNTPALVEIDKSGDKQRSWKFEDIIADVFVFDSRVSVAMDGGAVFSLKEGVWEKSSLSLAEQPRIVFSDGKKHLIACSPSSLLKEDTRQGGCKSFNPDWKRSFSWREVKPRVCGDLLYAVTWEQNRRLAIDLESGEIVHEGAYMGGDVCAQFSR